ncbi:ComZ family protein [Cytobacillus sp. FSL W7-1323]|uniref:ComZ family protein n=1 Tax=Cytobacillus stercorigallinarum TaxID=2762240 RepID=A0ABR8QRB1_9BACI|nr:MULTISPECIES: ComZ family protein [Cytobacillus]MBD7938066.1 ComZ family protein [Cytobacillus stercorigallinarum]MCA1027461.1 ComZ family protein [Cytobacillus kochii]MCM3322031.1 ComZ family protein [Cytobacillus kochii]MCM3343137.1 ComZ family protein [Cytobacillus kochii]MDM5206970.1 ComZ family protein [Cytobacillus kochii]
MSNDKTMEFMQIAMKYLPEAKAELEKSGVNLSMEMIQPFMTMFTQVMNEAYELGKADAQKEHE